VQFIGCRVTEYWIRRKLMEETDAHPDSLTMHTEEVRKTLSKSALNVSVWEILKTSGIICIIVTCIIK
jgi:hypothetical protein